MSQMIDFVKRVTCYNLCASQAHANMCAGYYKLMVAARQENKIMIPNPQFDNELVRYEHRFGAFANLLTPPLMPYSQFKVGYTYFIWTIIK